MKTAYFDCSSGISGNMFLGALIDAGLSKCALTKELKKLKLDNYRIVVSKRRKNGILATHVEVKLKKKESPRTLKELTDIIEKSKLSKDIKTKAKHIITRLAAAEAKIHGMPKNKVHLHDVGGTDALVDIAGTLIGLEELGIKNIYSGAVHTGKGAIQYVHGTLPIPSPAAAELLKNIPIYSKGVWGELATPTGAALISSLAKGFGDIPRIKVDSIGYGAGTKDLTSPNVLRMIIGEAENPYEEDAVLMIETNIDDMDPKLYDRAIARLMKAGALDAYITPIRMKKKRTASTFTILAKPENKDRILEALFGETTTLGARIYLVKREKLRREIRRVDTKFGRVRVKVGKAGEKIKTVAPEYEDLKRVKKKYKVPIEKIYDANLFSL